MSSKYFETRERSMSKQAVRRRMLISFMVFFVLFGGAACLWFSLYRQPLTADNLQPVLRKGLHVNERFFSRFYSAARQTKSFKPADAVTKVRVNGNVGMDTTFDAANWKLQIARQPGDTLFLTMDDIKALPKTEVVFDFKCVEGWSQVTHWGGVRFADFLKKYNLAPQQGMKYVGLSTPDDEYYVGLDMPSMLQPQTILCYEMNGKPLPMNQGYPLRLIIPVKYGIKHLKRIGVMYFSNSKPKDYWAEQGYDYYAGL